MTNSSFIVDLCCGERTAHIVCNGELGIRGASELRAAVDAAVHERSGTIVVNGEGVTELSHAAADVLADAASTCQGHGVKLELVLSDEGWKTIRGCHAGSLLSGQGDFDYQVPRVVVDALRDVTSERELYEGFYGPHGGIGESQT